MELLKPQEDTVIRKDIKRVEWADVSKAFAIWLMVFAHANLNNDTLMCMIYTFHMPLFFLISGYFDKGQGLSWSMLQKNFHALIIPYFLYSILGLSICWISPYAHPELYYGMNNFSDIYKAAIKGMFLMEDKVRPTSFMPIGCLWFLPALFLCKTMWASVCSCIKSKMPILVVFPVGIAVALYYFHPNYFSVDSAVMGLPFYGLGYFLKSYQVIEKHLSNIKICVAVFILLAFYNYFFGIKNGRVDMDGCNSGHNILLFYFNAVLGSIACICLANVFHKFEYLQKIGLFSLTILATHAYVIYACKALAAFFFQADLYNFPIWGSALIACLSCILVVAVRSKYNLKWLR